MFIDHLTAGDYLNRVTITINAPAVISRTGRFSIDFHDHDRPNLGGKNGSVDWATGTEIACVLKNGTIV